MLTPIGELDENNKSLCQTYNWLALDKTNGNYIIRSSDFDHGQKGMYIFFVRNKMTIVIWADSDQQAINKANYDL